MDVVGESGMFIDITYDSCIIKMEAFMNEQRIIIEKNYHKSIDRFVAKVR